MALETMEGQSMMAVSQQCLLNYGRMEEVVVHAIRYSFLFLHFNNISNIFNIRKLHIK